MHSFQFGCVNETDVVGKIQAFVHNFVRRLFIQFDRFPFDWRNDIVVWISGASEFRPAFTHSFDRFPFGCVSCRHMTEQILENVRAVVSMTCTCKWETIQIYFVDVCRLLACRMTCLEHFFRQKFSSSN